MYKIAVCRANNHLPMIPEANDYLPVRDGYYFRNFLKEK